MMRYEALLAAVVGLAGCTSPRADQSALGPAPQPPAGVTHRAFRMGFTTWPYAATIEAVQGTYAFIGANADLITEHLEEGVPWAEMLRDEPLPQWFLAKMAGRQRSVSTGLKGNQFHQRTGSRVLRASSAGTRYETLYQFL